jgi:hypothetical protein
MRSPGLKSRKYENVMRLRVTSLDDLWSHHDWNARVTNIARSLHKEYRPQLMNRQGNSSTCFGLHCMPDDGRPRRQTHCVIRGKANL